MQGVLCSFQVRSESATVRRALAELRSRPSSLSEKTVSRIGTAPWELTIEGTERATPSMPWKSWSTVLTGMTACSSRRIASTIRALESPIA